MSPRHPLDQLFTPFTVAGLTVTNRFAMAPMTRSRSPHGVPGDDVAAYYERRARGGVGLLITEGTTIGTDSASGDASIPNIYQPAALRGWEQVVGRVHAAGGRIIPQLWHQGPLRTSKRAPVPDAVTQGPSDGTSPWGEPVHAMSVADIEATVAAFGRGAAAAHQAGFDGIELHGAHGYLIDAFLWEGTNHREDAYGGSIEARTRFAAEIIAACRAEVPRDFPIAIRLSQWKTGAYDAQLARDPGELERLLTPMIQAGVDMFHCSTRRFWRPEFAGSDLNLAGWVRRISGLPTVTVGSVGLDDSDFTDTLSRGTGGQVHDLDRLVEMFDEGQFDLVAVGRALLQDPTWVAKVREGRWEELQPFTAAALKELT